MSNLKRVSAFVLCAVISSSASAATMRCGWFDNPSPGNASLHDAEGEWTVAVQGGHQAAGEWPPKFRKGWWVNTGAGSYGYGCACLSVDVDAAEKNILKILSSSARALAVCRADRAISAVEKRLK